jgi:hypothetical protein
LRDGANDLLEQDRARLMVGEHQDLRAQIELLEDSFVRTLAERRLRAVAGSYLAAGPIRIHYPADTFAPGIDCFRGVSCGPRY